MSKKTSCEIILGSYEEFILGFQYNKKEEEAQQTFAVHSHTGSIRAVAHAGDLLASGGADDRIVVYDLKTRKEHCLLNHHNGTVNCLQFTNERTHLMSGGQDGTIAIARVGNWQLEKVWENAHMGAAILDIAIHSSGKLALTLGADCTLRTWNLVKGRMAYAINLSNKCKEPKNIHSIRWAADGVRFVLVGNNFTDLWSIDTGGLLKSYGHDQKLSSCIWKTDDKLLIGYEDGMLGVLDLNTSSVDKTRGHESRVKCMQMYGSKAVTASSSGEIKVWSGKLKLLCTANAGCRLTCMCIVPNDSLDKHTETALEEETIELVESSPKKKAKKDKEIVNIEESSTPSLVKNKKKIEKKPDQIILDKPQKKKRKSTAA